MPMLAIDRTNRQGRLMTANPSVSAIVDDAEWLTHRYDPEHDAFHFRRVARAAVPGVHIPGRAPSAFFSMLKPHTRIPPHTGVTNTRAIVHLPLIVPPGCGFRVGGETREWKEGTAFAFDDTIEHEAWNDSDELRAVLIFDVWNPHMTTSERELLLRYFASADASGYAVPR